MESKYKYRVIIPIKALSVNQMYRSASIRGHAMTYMSAIGKKTKEIYKKFMKEQWPEKPLSGKIRACILYSYDDNRTHDTDNPSKALLDSGSGILWEDDKQIVEETSRKVQREYFGKDSRLNEMIIIDFDNNIDEYGKEIDRNRELLLQARKGNGKTRNKDGV